MHDNKSLSEGLAWSSRIFSYCAIMGLFALLGYWLDQKFETKFLIIVFAFGGGTASFYSLYKTLQAEFEKEENDRS
jgi:hypothetical protein